MLTEPHFGRCDAVGGRVATFFLTIHDFFISKGHERGRAGPDPVRRRLPAAGARAAGLRPQPAAAHLQRRPLLRTRVHAAAAAAPRARYVVVFMEAS